MVTRYFISVRNIPWTVSHLDFETYFAAYGKIKQAKVIFDKCGLSTGYGFVEYYDEHGMNEALVTSPHTLEEKLVSVVKGTKYLEEDSIQSLVTRYFITSMPTDEPKRTRIIEYEDHSDSEI